MRGLSIICVMLVTMVSASGCRFVAKHADDVLRAVDDLLELKGKTKRIKDVEYIVRIADSLRVCDEPSTTVTLSTPSLSPSNPSTSSAPSLSPSTSSTPSPIVTKSSGNNSLNAFQGVEFTPHNQTRNLPVVRNPQPNLVRQGYPKMASPSVPKVIVPSSPKETVNCVYCNGTGRCGTTMCNHCYGRGKI